MISKGDFREAQPTSQPWAGLRQELPYIVVSTNDEDTLEPSPVCHGSFSKFEPDLQYLRATLDPRAHLTLKAKINGVAALALVDSGAIGIFLHSQFTQECGAVVSPREYPCEVRMIDGRVINCGLITHEASVQVMIGDHCKILVANITNTRKYSCILSTPWLVCHDPTICWSHRDVQFDFSFC